MIALKHKAVIDGCCLLVYAVFNINEGDFARWDNW